MSVASIESIPAIDERRRVWINGRGLYVGKFLFISFYVALRESEGQRRENSDQTIH
jgi:hypothetical protein